MVDKYLDKASSQYQSEWDSFDNRSADAFLFGILFIGIAIATVVATRYESWLAGPLQILVIVAFAGVGYGSYRQFSAFKCPRCNKTFSAIRHDRNVWDADVCDHCELPRYYGSKKYVDLVGTERARAYAENLARWRGQ